MTAVLKYICAAIALSILTISCGVSDPSQQLTTKPTALGKMNEIVVVTDNDIWESHVGDTIKYFFGSVYPITPSPEPTFDLRRYEMADLNAAPLIKQLRTYLIVANLEDDDSPMTEFVKKDLGEERFQKALTDPSFHTSIGRNKWANGQILIYLFAKGLDDLSAAVESSYEGIAAKVNEHDREQLYQSSYSRGEGTGFISKMTERYGAEVKIPADYKLVLDAPEDNGMIWLRRDTKDAIINLAVRQFPYTGPESVAKENIKKNFNDFGRKYVSSPAEGSYVVINDVDLPMLEWNREISGHYAKEYRGIWEMENDFMGGPFQSYVIVNEKAKKMIQIDGFIMAPGKDKRNMMQQIELIASRTKW